MIDSPLQLAAKQSITPNELALLGSTPAFWDDGTPMPSSVNNPSSITSNPPVFNDFANSVNPVSQSSIRQNHFGEFNAAPEFGQTFGGGADNAQPEDTQHSFDDFINRQKYEKVAEGFGYKTPNSTSPITSPFMDAAGRAALTNQPLELNSFRSRYGVSGLSPRSDLSGSSRKLYGVPDDYLSRALSHYNTTGSFAGAKDVPVNLEQGLDWVMKNYGSTTSTPSGKLIEITAGSRLENFGTPGQYLSLISSKNAGDTWALWNKNPDGTFTNAGIRYYDSQKDHNNALGSLLPLALAFVPGMQGLAVGLGDAILGGASFLSPVVGNAAIGGLTSAVSGGNPLTGALAGGVGGFMAGSNFAGDMGISDPMLQKAVNSTLTSGAKQLINTGDINPEGLLMNGAIGYGSNLAGNTLGEQFGLSPEATKGLTGGLNAFGRQLVYNSPTASKAPVSNNPYASLYQQYLKSKGG